VLGFGCGAVGGLMVAGEPREQRVMLAEIRPDTIQLCYNLLNPSAAHPMGPGFPFQDFGKLMHHAVDVGAGVIAIRALAGGALAGNGPRHQTAAAKVTPIASSATYADDVRLAARFDALIRDGWAVSRVDAALRFALSQPLVSTTLVGVASLSQLEEAIASAERGALPDAALSHALETGDRTAA
jgi:aryl-alcohol dehydrogenase-like predicted oxidoreductase